MGLHNTVAID